MSNLGANLGSNLGIDAERLWDSLMETAQIGGTPDGGIARLTLSDDIRRVRDWLSGQCAALGMTMVVDEVGNMFATRPGTNSDLPAIAMGSHLDTQPTGGKFDGVLGVLAGLEVLRTLDGAGYRTEAPLMLVNWTNEEGSRRTPAVLGSGIWAGVYSRDYGDARTDISGDTFGASLERIGYPRPCPRRCRPLRRHVRAAYRAGPDPRGRGARIGVVQGIQGMRWFELTLTGMAAHTGSTPMRMRQNALLGMAQVIEGVERIAAAHEDAVGTIGFLEISPNSHNVIPGEVRAIDLRHPSDAVLDRMQAELETLVREVAAAVGLGHRLAPISCTAPVAFDAECIASVRAGARAAGHATRDIVSGAGHDAAHTAAVAPTTMIFVPSAGGLSHNPAGSTLPENARPARRCCSRRCWITTAAWPMPGICLPGTRIPIRRVPKDECRKDGGRMTARPCPLQSRDQQLFSGADAAASFSPKMGAEALAAADGYPAAIGAFHAFARSIDARIEVPVLAHAMPSGPVEDEAFETMAQAIVAAVGRGCGEHPAGPARRHGAPAAMTMARASCCVGSGRRHRACPSAWRWTCMAISPRPCWTIAT